jgi:ElaB/YqjD/DUF883 family membrane-anchored ribosome-binding protein
MTKLLEHGIEEAQERIEQGRKQLKESVNKSVEQAQAAWDGTVKWVQDHPAKAILTGVAAVGAAGIVTGLFLGRRSISKPAEKL